ncbi:DUF3238 domain-containing protein [Hazenella sp. IB182357]|uniref:DUF3238 domain-containing protein n=1 Tax=Polycladospora coralii TaxID=2771432 RepID=A0A926NAQ1_9BACL|nr:DUF3238 domain-containing protein [Polycladospora coralii]MBD1372998.1 DUF3238 domain-containing protein [Polycladospora coralii]
MIMLVTAILVLIFNVPYLPPADIDILNPEEIEQHFRQSQLEIVVDPTQVTLYFDYIPDADGRVEIYRDGKKIGETTSHHYIDRHRKSNKPYTYEIRGLRKRTPTEQKKIFHQLQLHQVRLTPQISKQLRYHEYRLSKTISQDPISTSHSNTTYTLRYTTFIPHEKVFLFRSYYKGDHRTFSPVAASYRTRVDVTADFPAKQIRDRVYIGETVAYHRNGKLRYRGYASKKGIKFASKSAVGCQAIKWSYTHSARNPHTKLAPSLNWQYDATIWKNGDWQIVGQHDGAPAHELYLSANHHPWQTIYQYQASQNTHDLIAGLIGYQVSFNRSGHFLNPKK